MHPDVIFEELSYEDSFIYEAGYIPVTIEAKTIKRHMEKYPIEHIPVDTYEMTVTNIFMGYDIIANNSVEYTELVKEQLSMMICLYGYTFLNSSNCVEIFDRMHIIEGNVLLDINNAKLSYQYKLYNELHDKRENEMLQNIYNYSKLNQYENAIFICGAEHRKSIIQKIQEYERKETFKLNWVTYMQIVCK
ncbi:MAG: hypothetical protein FWF53_04950 [Candidatus Azobacteroides sp.]|nr:hypothetical protein [Candidatus Azobacteroides sp.]